MSTQGSLSFSLGSEVDTERLGIVLGKVLSKPSDRAICVYLSGDLGSGKTTLTRYILAGFGHEGVVKSPTYTLVEPYKLEGHNVYHFDLYRLSDPGELEYLGTEEYFTAANSVCIVEWPDRGRGFLPQADITLELNYGSASDAQHQTLENKQSSRSVSLQVLNPDYLSIVNLLKKEFVC